MFLKHIFLVILYFNYVYCCQQHPCLFYTAAQRQPMWQKVTASGSKSKIYFDSLPNAGSYGTDPWVSGRTTLFGAAAFKCALNPASTITTIGCASALNALQSFMSAKATPTAIPNVPVSTAGLFVNALIAYDNLEALMPNDVTHNAIRQEFISLLEGWLPKYKAYATGGYATATASMTNALIPIDSFMVLALRILEGSPYTTWTQNQIDVDYDKAMQRLVNGAHHTKSDVYEGYNYDLQYSMIFLIRALKMAELRDGEWPVGDAKDLLPYTVTRDYSGRELWWIGDAIDLQKGLGGVTSTLTYLIGRLAQTKPDMAAEAMTQFWIMMAARGGATASNEIGFWLHHDFSALYYPDSVPTNVDLSAAIPSWFMHDTKNQATVVGDARWHGAALPGDGGRLTMYNTLAGNSRIGLLFQAPSGFHVHRTAFETLDIAMDIGDWRALLLPGRGSVPGGGLSHRGIARNIVVIRGDAWTSDDFNYYGPSQRCDANHNHGVTVHSVVEGRWSSGMSASSPWMWLHDKNSVARRSILFISAPQNQPYALEATHVQKVGGVSRTYDYMLRSNEAATILSSNVLRFASGTKKLDFTFLTNNVVLSAPTTGDAVYMETTHKNTASITTSSMASFFVVHEPHLSGATSSSVKREGTINGGVGGGGAAAALDFGGSFVDLVVMRGFEENDIEAGVGESSEAERTVRTDAIVAVVRVSRVSGVVESFSALDATYLSIDGFDLLRVQSASGRVSVSSGLGVQIRASGSPMQSMPVVDASVYAPPSFMAAVPSGYSKVMYDGSAMNTQREGDFVVFGTGGGGSISGSTSPPVPAAPTTTASPTTFVITTASPTISSSILSPNSPTPSMVATTNTNEVPPRTSTPASASSPSTNASSTQAPQNTDTDDARSLQTDSLPTWVPFAVGGCVLCLLVALLAVVCISLSRRRRHHRQRRASSVQDAIGMRRTSTSSRASSRPGTRRSARSSVFGLGAGGRGRTSQYGGGASGSRPSSRIHTPMPANPQLNTHTPVGAKRAPTPPIRTPHWTQSMMSMSTATARPMPPPPPPRQRPSAPQYDSVPY